MPFQVSSVDAPEGADRVFARPPPPPAGIPVSLAKSHRSDKSPDRSQERNAILLSEWQLGKTVRSLMVAKRAKERRSSVLKKGTGASQMLFFWFIRLKSFPAKSGHPGVRMDRAAMAAPPGPCAEVGSDHWQFGIV